MLQEMPPAHALLVALALSHVECLTAQQLAGQVSILSDIGLKAGVTVIGAKLMAGNPRRDCRCQPG